MLVKIAVTVLVTFALCWQPFLSDPEQALQVLRRVFPVARGLFEFYLSSAVTLLAVAPSSLKLLKKPTFWHFKLSLVNSSLGFFLFSYQVHEKSILLVALPVCLLLNDLPLIAIWFLQVSTFSMLPLLLKDGLLVPYAVTSVAFVCIGIYLLSAMERCTEAQLHLDAYRRLTKWLPAWNLARIVRRKFYVSVVLMVALSVASAALPPPAALPDLFPVLVSAVSFVHFLGTFVYFNVIQLSTGRDRQKNK
ncbi:hypothetical protein NHX12_033834 [Muraenolepis orangiensis]|uniref:Alpha-1,3-glucosyltransferase n=1 Tax=Muraenolepis orangiensis TaxID=630683 RepID=A0A9Q0E3E5_9TELE|nr:hypothetical protein NHX12_033834 [Muraenolepis orangiensis]